MPPEVSRTSGPLATLHEVNEQLRSALLRLRPERTHCSAVRAQDLSDLLQQILRAAECLRNLLESSGTMSPVDTDEIEKEFREYRGNLEKLRRFLPDLQGRLLAEKSRLEAARSHSASAAKWAQTARKTV